MNTVVGGEATKAPASETTFWGHVKKYALRYFALIGLAMGCAAQMEGVLKVSSWVGYFTRYYRRVLLDIYAALANAINFHPPAYVWDMIVMALFYAALMTYGATRGKPRDIVLETRAQKVWFVVRRVPISVLTATTCMIFAGASATTALRFAMLFWPASTLMFGFIAWRLTRVRYQLDHEYVRFLAATWVLIGILLLLSQTQVFEYLAGEPPPAPTIDSPEPFFGE
jgi:hypothetical protein